MSVLSVGLSRAAENTVSDPLEDANRLALTGVLAHPSHLS